MKSFMPALALSMTLLATPALAGFHGPSDTLQIVDNVQAAVQAPDMTTCVLEGHIIKHTEKNRYVFQDPSGTMTIDIPPHVFRQVDVTPQDTVRITGETGKGKKAEAPDIHLRVRYIEKIS